MHRSKIEWVLNPDNKTLGWVWNPITGCLNGCEYCYARKLANGRLKKSYLANENVSKVKICGSGELDKSELDKSLTDPFYPRFWEERLEDLIVHPKKRKGIFVCDMGELFGDWLPREWQDKIFRVIRAHPQHRFYLLTKQPQNLIKFSPFPYHCYVGVTATNQEQYLAATRWKGLDGVKASVKYISFEPLLESIQPSEYRLKSVNWVIIGAQTKPYKPPKIEWVEEIEEAARKAGVVIFEKDNLRPLLNRDLIQKLP